MMFELAERSILSLLVEMRRKWALVHCRVLVEMAHRRAPIGIDDRGDSLRSKHLSNFIKC